MDNYPETALEFEDRFATEDACCQYLAEIRWPNGFRCPRCEHPKAWITDRGLWHCTACGHETSVTSGTVFQDTRKPLRLWFRAMWYLVSQKQGVSALGLQRVLGLSRYETTWLWLHKLRAAMVRPDRDRLSGTVQVDETYIGGERTGKRGRGAEGKTLVVIAVEDQGKHIGRIRLLRVPDASAASLNFALQEMITPGSVVNTDGWVGYATVGNKGYIHEQIRPVAEVGDNLLPLAHRVTSLLKRWLGATHQGAVRPSHLDYYLDEFTFRFNRRTSRSRGKLFYRLMQQAVQIAPVTGDDIRGGKR